MSESEALKALAKKVKTQEKQINFLTSFVFKLIRGSDICKHALKNKDVKWQCFHPENMGELKPCTDVTSLKDCPMFKRAGMIQIK